MTSTPTSAAVVATPHTMLTVNRSDATKELVGKGARLTKVQQTAVEHQPIPIEYPANISCLFIYLLKILGVGNYLSEAPQFSPLMYVIPFALDWMHENKLAIQVIPPQKYPENRNECLYHLKFRFQCTTFALYPDTVCKNGVIEIDVSTTTTPELMKLFLGTLYSKFLNMTTGDANEAAMLYFLVLHILKNTPDVVTNMKRHAAETKEEAIDKLRDECISTADEHKDTIEAQTEDQINALVNFLHEAKGNIRNINPEDIPELVKNSIHHPVHQVFATKRLQKIFEVYHEGIRRAEELLKQSEAAEKAAREAEAAARPQRKRKPPSKFAFDDNGSSPKKQRN